MVAAALGVPDVNPMSLAAAGGKQQQRHGSPMRKRIVNLALPAAAAAAAAAAPQPPRSATSSPEPGCHGTGGCSPSPGVAGVEGGTSRSLQVISGLQQLEAANAALPLGLRSQLRASAPSSCSGGGGSR